MPSFALAYSKGLGTLTSSQTGVCVSPSSILSNYLPATGDNYSASEPVAFKHVQTLITLILAT